MNDVQRYHLPRRKALTAEERRAVERARAFVDCKQGRHHTTPTFRPGETVCLVCGMVVYCPPCLDAYHLPSPTAERAFPLPCLAHQATNVQKQEAHTPHGKDVRS